MNKIKIPTYLGWYFFVENFLYKKQEASYFLSLNLKSSPKEIINIIESGNARTNAFFITFKNIVNI